MQAEYRREIDGNYLVVQVQEGQPEDYTLQMLSYNQPESFLHLKTSELNGHPVLMYEVTSMQPVGRIFERSGVGKEQMELMLNGLTLVLEDARKYLLSPSDLVLDPDHIYYDPGRKKIRKQRGMLWKLTGKRSHDMICMNWRPGLSPAVQ